MIAIVRHQTRYFQGTKVQSESPQPRLISICDCTIVNHLSKAECISWTDYWYFWIVLIHPIDVTFLRQDGDIDFTITFSSRKYSMWPRPLRHAGQFRVRYSVQPSKRYIFAVNRER